MSITYTTLLGLAQPTPGTESGTWGTTINDSLTALLETAIAGSKTADVTSSNWTLTDIDGADDTARAAVLIPTGTNGATTRSILAPNQSKIYVIINQASGSVVIKGVTGPTTGVTIPTGKTTLVAWNGSDFVEITPSTISGTLPVANGGTGNTTGTATINANLTGAITSIGNTTSLSSFTSANLAAALTDETGGGAAVFASNPTFPAQINLTNNSGYNIYASGTADNYLASNLGIGANAGNIGGLNGYISMNVAVNMGGSSNATGVWQKGQLQSTVTNAGYGYRNSLSTAAATFTVPAYHHYYASQSTLGSGSTVATQYGFYVASSLTGASLNIGFAGNIAAGTSRYNLFMSGTADNLLNGPLSIGTGSPADASAILDVQSTTKGVRMPNMTTTQKNAISSPTAGLMVFDTTLSKLCVYSGSAWQTITSV
jgi:hypothetical protein